MNFRNIIKDFLDITDDDKLGIYMIHLSRAIERVPLIKTLEEKLNIQIPIFEAKDGNELIKNGCPRGCPTRPSVERGAGEVGCAMSHYYIYKDALEKGYESIIVFEDDCMFNRSLEELSNFLQVTKEYLKSSNKNIDLFTLGSLGNITYNIETSFLLKISEFNGTNALLMNKKFIIETIDTMDIFLNNKKIPVIDWILSYVLKTKQLDAYCCIDAEYFFEQKKGLYSYIIEGIRK